MNKKLKVLSSAFCGLVLSSGIALTSVQAAPVQINSAAISAASTSQSYLLKARITTDGLLYWDNFEGVEEYEIRMVRLLNANGGYATGAITKDHFEDNEYKLKWAFNTAGFYLIKIRGYDANDNVIIQDVVFAYYDGSTIKQRDLFNEDYI